MKCIVYILITMLMHVQVYAVSQATVIDRSGVYNFRGDVVGVPTDADDVTVSIEADHVIFDLSGYTISQDPSNTVTGLSGIRVVENISDVIIRNGTIQQLTGTGIIVSDGCSDIRIDNFYIKQCDAGGILCDGLSTGTGISKLIIDNCIISSCTGTQNGPAVGMQLNDTTGFELRNSCALQNDAQLISNGFGINLVGCTFGKIVNCLTNDNGGNLLGAGISISLSSNIILEACKSMQNIARSSDSSSLVAGFYVNQSDKIIFKECESIQNLNTGQASVGFYLNDGTGNILGQCVAQANQGSVGAAGVRLIDQTSTCIQNCESTLNEATSSGTTYGIHLSGSVNDRCFVLRNNLIANNGAGSEFGLVDDRVPSTSFFIQNNAFNNGTTNYSITYAGLTVLPLIVADLSAVLTNGLPALLAGELDNIDCDP